jgi:hypothetical protein
MCPRRLYPADGASLSSSTTDGSTIVIDGPSADGTVKGANIGVGARRSDGWEDRDMVLSFVYVAFRAALGSLVRSRRGLDVKGCRAAGAAAGA